MDTSIVVHCDNKACLRWASTFCTGDATKHFLQELRFAQHGMEDMGIKCIYVKSASNIADIMTKGTAGPATRSLMATALGHCNQIKTDTTPP